LSVGYQQLALFRSWRRFRISGAYFLSAARIYTSVEKGAIEYCAVWILMILFIPWIRLKFLDEAHFVSKDLYRRRIGGPKGYKLFLIETAALDLSYSMTLLTNLADPDNPFFISLRYASNTEWDFFFFLLDAIEAGYLVWGSILVVDNASIYFGGSTWELIVSLLHAFGISYIFMPTYSPELNPCDASWPHISCPHHPFIIL